MSYPGGGEKALTTNDEKRRAAVEAGCKANGITSVERCVLLEDRIVELKDRLEALIPFALFGLPMVHKRQLRETVIREDNRYLTVGAFMAAIEACEDEGWM